MSTRVLYTTEANEKTTQPEAPDTSIGTKQSDKDTAAEAKTSEDSFGDEAQPKEETIENSRYPLKFVKDPTTGMDNWT